MYDTQEMNQHLDELEAESMFIMREVVAECEKPVMLYSSGKDSSVMMHLAMKAFYPEKPPFPFLHIDTTWKLKEMIEFRDRKAKELGIEMLVYQNEDGIRQGINPFDHGSLYTDIMKTQALKQALDKYGFTAAFEGARWDEEKSRAKERIFSFQNQNHVWNSKAQRPELWDLYNARVKKGESIRVFPILNWTEKDIWLYIQREQIEIVPFYYAKERPVVYRDGNIIMVDDERFPLQQGEEIQMKKIRFRTLGCYPLTGGFESEADTLDAIIAETLGAVSSERTSRVIDHEEAGSMERRKREGDFSTGKRNLNPSKNMPWYKKETLLEYLEKAEIHEGRNEEGFLMPVQRVCQPNHSFGGYQGTVTSGAISVGDEVTILPSGERSQVQSLLCATKSVNQVEAGQAVTIQLEKEVDVSRGCVLARGTDLKQTKMFQGNVLWMDDHELVQGRTFLMKIATKTVSATVMSIKYKIDVNTGSQLRGQSVLKNEIAVCEFALAENTVFSSFQEHKALGRFILIDRFTNMTLACGVINFALRRSENITWQKLDITREVRAQKMQQKPFTLWFTGLSGSGKSTLANELEKALSIDGKYTMLLDGDNVRMGLNKDLGFEEKDRIENIRRVAEVSKLMNDAGLIVITSFISPYEMDRQNAKNIIGSENFVEVYVDTSLEECERRDVKGLYKKARNNQIPNFTGITSPFEVPVQADIVVHTEGRTVEACVKQIIDGIQRRIM